MAEKSKSIQPKKRVRKLKAETSMRELSNSKKEPAKSSRIRKVGSRAKQPFVKVRNFGRKEYHPVKLPDNRAGRILNKRVRFVPKFFTNAWYEIRKVVWPGRRETIRLSFAVFIFSVVFSLIVASLDFVLGKVFKMLFVG